jgi:valyl-tRNA synthetase
MRNATLRQLKVFETAARHLSFSRAAEELHLSQPAGSAQVVVNGETIAFPLAGHIDLDSEKARLAKAAEAAEKERDSLGARLANPNFVERAKPEAVEKARSDHAEKSAEAERYRAALDRLG